MPPRWLGWFIVVFWLATTGWLFWHDLWPRWLSGEPPLLRPDDVEEVKRRDNNRMPILWIVERQEKDQAGPFRVFHAQTWVDYHKDDDSYRLNARLDANKVPKYQPVCVANILKIDRITSAYHVNRSGQLLSLEATAIARFPTFDTELTLLRQLLPPQPALVQKDPSDRILFSIRGEVHDRQFFARCCAAVGQPSQPDGEAAGLTFQPDPRKSMQLDLPPTAVSYSGSVLMPLHPVNHLRGLRSGQKWRQPLVDPLHGGFASLTDFSGGVRWLNAHVLPQPEILELNGNEMSCLIIEYTSDENEPMGRTWVEQDSEQVLQQEALFADGRWTIKRDLPSRSHKRPLGPRHD